MKQNLVYGLLALVFAIMMFSLTSCSDDDNNTNNNNTGCAMSAKVNGAAWCTTAFFVRDNDTGVLTINGTNATTHEVIQIIVNNSALGTFPINSVDVIAGYHTGAQVLYIGESGTLTITKMDASLCEGTFSFVGESVNEDQKQITEGKFKATRIN